MKRILFPLESFDNPTGGGISALTIIKGINRQKFLPIILFPTECKIAEELGQIPGIQVQIWPLHEPAGLVQYGRDIIRCLNFFKKHNIDVIHFNHLGYWKPAEILAAKILHIPIITHLRLIHKDPSPFLKWSDVIIANSMFTAQASLIPPEKVTVVYNAVEIERIDQARDLRAELGIEQQTILISFIGSIKQVKGIEMFLELANAIREPQVKFLIVGESDDQDYAATIQPKIEQNSQILSLGYRRDIENIYHTSDIIVMPSQWDEPFGRIAIEAGAARKPIIATKVGGLPEIIEHGRNGYLVAKDDFASLLLYTRQLIRDGELRKTIGEEGRKIVEEKFSLKKHLREVEKIYERLL